MIRPGRLEYRVTRNWQQMVSGILQSKQAPVLLQGVDSPNRWALIGAASFRALDILQSKQAPVLLQGVDSPNRWALIGAASFRALDIALSTSLATLFIPTIISTFRGPAQMADTRLLFPSMLTRMPSSVMALELHRNRPP